MYDYQVEKPGLLTLSGQRMFLKIRDKVKAYQEKAKIISMGEAIASASGDSWEQMACVDYMVELGELREVKQEGYVPGQCRLFCKTF